MHPPLVRSADRLRRPVPLVAAAGLVTSLLCWGLLAGPAAASTPSTTSVLTSAKAAIKKQTGAHVVSTASSTSSTQEITSDIGVTSGQETSVDGSASVAIKVTPTNGYLSGNSDGLTSVFGLTSAQAKKVGSNWVSWKSGTSQYSEFKRGLTISTLTDVLPKVKGTSMKTTVFDGATFYVLSWTSKASGEVPKLESTLTISAAQRLPVTETSKDASGTTVTTSFSAWGETVAVTAPPASSTISSSSLSS